MGIPEVVEQSLSIKLCGKKYTDISTVCYMLLYIFALLFHDFFKQRK